MKSKRTTCWFINQTYYEKTEDFNQFMPKGYIIELDMNCKSCQDFVETNKKVLVRVSYPRPRLA